MKSTGQVLTNIKHGGHIVEPNATGAQELAAQQEGISIIPLEVTFETPFDYLFPQLATDPDALLSADNSAQVVAHLQSLGVAMIEKALASEATGFQQMGNSTIPPIYTYWGQFVDHDLTANTDRDPLVLSDITNPSLAPMAPAWLHCGRRKSKRLAH